ncbi:MAG: bifunctional UDP-N-acetylglucosamine diphosphorylase/glucosamine-1-phosphate N-acetyltransferase GlmU [Akkermansiaceae bacterium]|nr:bifunctional UDP-N-acetylglucosamine diphosphorylase/glucosamine-1-phosphate N-acetyltransferase GlmU [Armatimonadota bacterium]
MLDAAVPPPLVAAVVLAAGKSTRMRSRLPKVLHPVCGRPILAHILHTLADAGVGRRIAVIGHEAETVRGAMDTYFGAGQLEYAYQTEQKGTGHAVQMAEGTLTGFAGTVLVLAGDTPLLSADVLKLLLAEHAQTGATATVLTAVLPDAGAYGRIVRGEGGEVLGIVEAKDATAEQRKIGEINTGVFAFAATALFAALRDLKPNNAQGELYLTDVLGLLRDAGRTVRAVVSSDTDVILGVNTRVELAEIGAKMRARILRDLMLSGVTVEDPANTYVEAGVTVGQDTTLLPLTRLAGRTTIGEGCVLGPDANITDSVIGDNVKARACFIESAVIGDRCKIGPFAHIRPGSRLESGVRLGNFVEINRSSIGANVAAGHLTYLGDATVGAGTNVGAGTITCNYDGYAKHKTVIGENAFIGTHSTLVAPVSIGDRAFVAAASAVTEDVPPDALAIARQRQTTKEKWAERRRTEKAIQSGSEPKP